MVVGELTRLDLHMRSQGRVALYIWSRMSMEHVTLRWTTSTGRE